MLGRLALLRTSSVLVDCDIIGDDATQVSEGAIDAGVRRTVCLSWRGLIQHLSFLQVDGEAEVLGCIREAVDDVL